MASIDDILLQMKKTPADVRFADLSKICIHISVALVRKAEVIMFTSCGECRAFTGRNFLEDEYRDLRFDTQK